MVQAKSTRLDEVTLMRTILTLLIVLVHSFTCYQGGWPSPKGYVNILLYEWIARIAGAFTLEAFVFISGYLFAFQRINLNIIETAYDDISLVTKKLKRLILPSIIFSAFYFFLFFKYRGFWSFLYSIINGCGHLWFLPMLFWCFVGGLLLEKLKIGDGWKMAFLICLNLFVFIFTPLLQLHRAALFLFYFCGGYVVYKNFNSIKTSIGRKHIIAGWLFFVFVFVLLHPFKESLSAAESDSIAYKSLIFSARNACQLIYASVGTIALYITAVYYTQRHWLKSLTLKLASCCFGIYLFQEFILKVLYYKTDFSIVVGPYWLPWLGFVIALPLSYLITVISLKTKIGRFLIE